MFPAALAVLMLAACATAPLGTLEPTYTLPVAPGSVVGALKLDRSLEAKILALDPEHVTDGDVRRVLARGPTPRIINLHGGVYPVHLLMQSFSQFLIGMGFPEGKIRDPRDGEFSFSPYGDSERLTGEIAWYYEHDGMRPMLIGHSQGGMMAVKILYDLAGEFAPAISVWNPLTDESENRNTIIDPLTGQTRPVVGLKVAYASAVGAGGAALLMPNQWVMATRLRAIPDSVDEFVGYAIDFDLIALDLPGNGDASRYASRGKAAVRNVTLPSTYSHVVVPATTHLLDSDVVRQWINDYRPGDARTPPSDANTANILWAADVWYSIKKHWVLEAQALIRARRPMTAGR